MNKFILLLISVNAQDPSTVKWVCIPVSEIVLVSNGLNQRTVVEMKDGNVHRPLESFMHVVGKLGVES